MGLSKGQTNNPDGRKIGSKNKKTKQWEILGEAIVTRHSERFNQALDKLDDSEFVKAYTSILAYFKPKLGSATYDIKTDFEEQKELLRSIFPTEEELETADNLIRTSGRT